MKGLIALRQSTDAFRLKSPQDIKDRVSTPSPFQAKMVWQKRTW